MYVRCCKQRKAIYVNKLVRILWLEAMSPQHPSQWHCCSVVRKNVIKFFFFFRALRTAYYLRKVRRDWILSQIDFWSLMSFVFVAFYSRFLLLTCFSMSYWTIRVGKGDFCRWHIYIFVPQNRSLYVSTMESTWSVKDSDGPWRCLERD